MEDAPETPTAANLPPDTWLQCLGMWAVTSTGAYLSFIVGWETFYRCLGASQLQVGLRSLFDSTDHDFAMYAYHSPANYYFGICTGIYWQKTWRSARPSPGRRRMGPVLGAVLLAAAILVAMWMTVPQQHRTVWALTWGAVWAVYVSNFVFQEKYAGNLGLQHPQYSHRLLYIAMMFLALLVMSIPVAISGADRLLSHSSPYRNKSYITPAPGAVLNLPADGAALVCEGSKAWLFLEFLPVTDGTHPYRVHLYPLASIADVRHK